MYEESEFTVTVTVTVNHDDDGDDDDSSTVRQTALSSKKTSSVSIQKTNTYFYTRN
jgi:hypothetical protein